MIVRDLKIYVNTFYFEFNFQAESDITAYTYERTLMMEQRTEMLKSMRVAKMQPQAIVDKSHAAVNDVRIKLDTVTEELESSTDDTSGLDRNQYTFTPSGSGTGITMEKMAESINKNVLELKP